MRNRIVAFVKYEADPYDLELRDCADLKWCSLSDPDFWKNEIPVWGVCRPDIRAKLKPGDVVLFIPKILTMEKWTLPHKEYICSGLLVVSELLSGRNQVKSDKRLKPDYTQDWAKDIEGHSNGEKRERNFVIGTPVAGKKSFESAKSKPSWMSRWFGSHGNKMKDILNGTGYPYASLFTQNITRLHESSYPGSVERIYLQAIASCE